MAMVRLSLARRKHLGLVASAIILSAGALAGLEALPLGAQGETVAHLQPVALPVSRPLSGRPLPVFLFDGAGDARRVGEAAAEPSGSLRVRLYAERAGEAAAAPVVVLLHADTRLLWSLASDANKAQARAIADAWVRDARAAAGAIVASERFRTHYREVLQAIAGHHVGVASNAPEVEGALDRMLQVLDESFDAEFVARYAKVLLDEFNAALQPVILAPYRLEAHRQLLRDIASLMRKPAARQLVAEHLREVLKTPESAELLTAFATAFLGGLIEDARFFAVIRDIAGDDAFAGEVDIIERASVNALRELARLLVGIDRADRMHPIATAVLRALVFDEARWIVAYVGLEQAAELRRSLPGGMVVLAEARP